MALSTVPKTDWSATDGVTNIDLNEIGDNLQSLEDTKAELSDATQDFVASSVTATDVDTVTMDASGDVSVTGVTTLDTTVTGDLTVNGTLLDKNGNEVLSLMTDYRESTATYTDSSGTKTVSPTLSFSSTVLGIAHVIAYDSLSSNNNDPQQAPIQDINISGSNVTVTIRVSPNEDLAGRRWRVMLTAFVQG